MIKFFWYERNFSGKYCPVGGPKRPEKSQAGPTPARFVVTELKPDEYDLSLTILARIYPPPDDAAAYAAPSPEPEPDCGGATVETTEQEITT